ncbi:class II lanthipeptide, LchA2/BrtA2 family [Priestia endophytica]|uniref:class II lanthipeptide, LchA2/BrtA2 family n=1 Tax=Priestia endophytica TaxID=135735 RepID=UPI00124F21B8|nr:class II lanthipeptide, LchA2/BrtA2 family [Priestia endophytica]KAB2489472.1 hypothetical protein F8155_23650 [Priestia endophytica]
MKNEFNKIGLVDEEELKSLAGASEVNPRSSIPCAGALIAGGELTWKGIEYTLKESAKNCPTTSCSTRC